MDVHIGEISADIDATSEGTTDDAQFERLARRIMALVERRERAAAQYRRDCGIESADRGDVERYG